MLNLICKIILVCLLYRVSKLQKTSFMYVTYCKRCPLSSVITENVLYVYKPLHVMSFNPNSVNFHG
ncbi:hypothetical protein Hanom_Chr03g00219581 [Helianthus anomalus]